MLLKLLLFPCSFFPPCFLEQEPFVKADSVTNESDLEEAELTEPSDELSSDEMLIAVVIFQSSAIIFSIVLSSSVFFFSLL